MALGLLDKGTLLPDIFVRLYGKGDIDNAAIRKCCVSAARPWKERGARDGTRSTRRDDFIMTLEKMIRYSSGQAKNSRGDNVRSVGGNKVGVSRTLRGSSCCGREARHQSTSADRHSLPLATTSH